MPGSTFEGIAIHVDWSRICSTSASLSGLPTRRSAFRSWATKLGVKKSTVSSFSTEAYLNAIPIFPIGGCLLWVTSRNITSDFSSGGYADLSSRSFSFLVTFSKRPEAVIHQRRLWPKLRMATMSAIAYERTARCWASDTVHRPAAPGEGVHQNRSASIASETPRLDSYLVCCS